MLQVPIESSLKFKLNMRPKKDKNIYSKLDEQVEKNSWEIRDDSEVKTCTNPCDNREIGKCAKPKSNIQCAFEGLPENVCDSIEVSFDDLKDCNSLPNDTFSDIPTNTFEDIEIAVQEN